MIVAFVPRSAMSVVQRPTHLLQPKYSSQFTSLGAATDGNGDSDFEKNDDDSTGAEDEASRLRKRAEDLREQIRKMEATLGDKRPRNYDMSPPPQQTPQSQADEGQQPCSLKKKRVLVVGANGRLGSMVCRYLLRNNPQTEVVACVHYVGENSMTSRGYGRLSYEVGAEDGVGRIGAAWSSEDRTATFEYADYMKDYNLKNLRLVECELLDPVQCNTICEGVDSVIWCASDFNGNKPRAISGLNVAFLFRAIAAPTKGRVEIEGLRNLLGGLKNSIQERKWKRERGVDGASGSGVGQSALQPINVALVSTAPEAFPDFETPFGTFNGLKREGEDIVKNEFPSLSYTILQMGRYDDNFVPEDLDILFDQSTTNFQEGQRRINRRDAAKAAVDALTDADLVGKTVQVWTKG
jgi:hypothetical protein